MAGGSGGLGVPIDEELRHSNVVRLRGLPFTANEADIRDFFHGFDFGPDGIVIQLNFQGRSTGQAYVQLANSDEANRALELNRQHIGSRYIEVFKGHPADMQGALRMVGRTHNSFNDSSTGILGSGFGSLGGHGMSVTGIPGMCGNPDLRYCGVVRMRGMPYSCTAVDITAFFKGLLIVPDGIYLCTHNDGRSTGEAYVEFASDEIASRAMQLNREPMGSRYVELFQSTKGEMMLAVQKRMYGMFSSGGLSGLSQLQGMLGGFGFQNLAGTNLAALQLASSGRSGYGDLGLGDNAFIKMRGLPYSAGPREIYEFFDGYRIVQNGVHIVLGHTDRPTGEAFVEFISSEEATRAMERHRHNIGSRYIELFRATKSEALMALGNNSMSNFGMGGALDPSMQLLILQQQQLQAAAMGWGMQSDMHNSAALASLYQRQLMDESSSMSSLDYDSPYSVRTEF